jgi:hypothetical protein
VRETSTAAKGVRRRYGPLHLAAALLAVALACVGCTSNGSSSHSSSPSPGSAKPTSPPAGSPSPSPSASSAADAIQPLTDTTSKDPGVYYSDPYPVHLAPSNHTVGSVYFSGTTKSLLDCATGTRAHCTAEEKIKVTAGPALRKAAARYGSRTTVADNLNIYQLDSGAWQMAATMYVKNPKFTSAAPWTVVVHAHGLHADGDSVPTAWVADSIVAGTFQHPEKADYDGKYYEDGGKLYLVYSKLLSDSPQHDGIVAQAMASPAEPAKSAPVVLLAPQTADGGYASEYFSKPGPDAFKLIETGNITKVDGKYVMAYSTGAFDRDVYKSGLAWSDTLIPAKGSSYRKILMKDPDGVWGRPGETEVRYLLQSQEEQWPNYVAGRVLAPGVPSVVESDGKWDLYFAGYLPSDAPKDSGGKYDASHRRPFVMPLAVDVPSGTSVRKASDAELARWITWA